MLFYDTKDESAWGLALVGLLVVVFAVFLSEQASNVQPKAPVEMTQPDVSSPDLHQQVEDSPGYPNGSSPYPQPAPGK